MGDNPLSSLSLDELADIMGVLRLNTDYLEFFGLREKKVLGFDTSGCGTSVVLACSERYGGITRVVKKRMTKKEILERTNKNLVSVKKSFLTELAILKHFPTHPNIIGGVHGVVCPDYLAVTMNYCEYGNLTRIIPHIDCVLLCIISTALVHAVAHLHHHRIVHNDINPKTIMFYRGTSGIMPVLTGFSHAEQVPTGQNYVDRDYYPGTDRDYFPPEISRNAAFRSDLFKVTLIRKTSTSCRISVCFDEMKGNENLSRDTGRNSCPLIYYKQEFCLVSQP